MNREPVSGWVVIASVTAVTTGLLVCAATFSWKQQQRHAYSFPAQDRIAALESEVAALRQQQNQQRQEVHSSPVQDDEMRLSPDLNEVRRNGRIVGYEVRDPNSLVIGVMGPNGSSLPVGYRRSALERQVMSGSIPR